MFNDYVPPAFAEHLEREQPPKFLYHYTGQAGLLGIVQGKELWCTKVQYMNDATEFGRALEMAREKLDRIVKSASKEDSSASSATNWQRGRACKELLRSLDGLENINLFAACFCEDGDLLSQWRGYAGGGYGFSIGFDTKLLTQSTMESGLRLGKCIYEPDVQNRIVEQAVEHCLRLAVEPTMELSGFHGPLADILFECGAFFKDPSFRNEREWRLVSPIVRSLDDRLAFRSGGSMITPYYKLSIVPNDTLPISHVIVGPCPNMELSKSSVTALLMKNWVHATQERQDIVIESKIPFRDW